MMFNRMMVQEFNNKCPHCGRRLSNGFSLLHIPYNCEMNPDMIKEKNKIKANEIIHKKA